MRIFCGGLLSYAWSCSCFTFLGAIGKKDCGFNWSGCFGELAKELGGSFFAHAGVEAFLQPGDCVACWPEARLFGNPFHAQSLHRNRLACQGIREKCLAGNARQGLQVLRLGLKCFYNGGAATRTVRSEIGGTSGA